MLRVFPNSDFFSPLTIEASERLFLDEDSLEGFLLRARICFEYSELVRRYSPIHTGKSSTCLKAHFFSILQPDLQGPKSSPMFHDFRDMLAMWVNNADDFAIFVKKIAERRGLQDEKLSVFESPILSKLNSNGQSLSFDMRLTEQEKEVFFFSILF